MGYFKMPIIQRKRDTYLNTVTTFTLLKMPTAKNPSFLVVAAKLQTRFVLIKYGSHFRRIWNIF